MAEPDPGPERLIVDAMNVIGSRPDGWWRDPDAAKRRLVDRLRPIAAGGRPVEVVIDGRPVADLPEGESGGLRVRYAGHSAPDAADDAIVALVAERADGLLVVTSDRALRGRVEALGARVVGARWLVDLMDGAATGPPMRTED